MRMRRAFLPLFALLMCAAGETWTAGQQSGPANSLPSG